MGRRKLEITFKSELIHQAERVHVPSAPILKCKEHVGGAVALHNGSGGIRTVLERQFCLPSFRLIEGYKANLAQVSIHIEIDKFFPWKPLVNTISIRPVRAFSDAVLVALKFYIFMPVFLPNLAGSNRRKPKA